MSIKTIILSIGIFAAGTLAALVLFMGSPMLTRDEVLMAPVFPMTPEEARYVVANEDILITELIEDAVYKDMNDDGNEDALVLFSREEDAGSVTFIAAALSNGAGFLGTNALVLDRPVDLASLSVTHGVLTLTERTTHEDENVPDRIYIMLRGATLELLAGEEEGDVLAWGTYGIIGDTHSFTSCAGDTYAIASSSPSYAALIAIHDEHMRYATALPLSVLLVGHRMEDGRFSVSTIVHAVDDAVCARRESLTGTSTVPTSTEEEESLD